jgi:Fic family protein
MTNGRINHNRLPADDQLASLTSIEINFETPEVMRSLTRASRAVAGLGGYSEAVPGGEILGKLLLLSESIDNAAVDKLHATPEKILLTFAGAQQDLSAANAILQTWQAAQYTGRRFGSTGDSLAIEVLIEMAASINDSDQIWRDAKTSAIPDETSGEIRYTPPSPGRVVPHKLTALGQFIDHRDASSYDPLVKLALIHYQFQAIQPFVCNGRIGRAFDTIYLVEQRLLPWSCLGINGYLLKHRAAYFRLLQAVTDEGKWFEWIIFFLDGLAESALIAQNNLRRLQILRLELEGSMRAALGLYYPDNLLDLVFQSPYITLRQIKEKYHIDSTAASILMKKLVDAKVLTLQTEEDTLFFCNHRLIRMMTSS